MSNEIIKHRSWLRRNLYWLFPLLLILVTAAYLIVSGVIGVGDYAQAYTDKQVFEEAARQVSQNERAKELLGDIAPIDRMTIAEGAVQYAEDNTSMTATITIEGSRGKGKMDIEAHKTDGIWVYDKIVVRVKEPEEKIIVFKTDLQE